MNTNVKTTEKIKRKSVKKQNRNFAKCPLK